jgi:hypothetical protein
MSNQSALKPNHVITVDKHFVYADKMKIGYHFKDGTGYFVNLIGDICKGFSCEYVAKLWIIGFADRHVEKVRQYLISKEIPNHNFIWKAE